MRFREEDMMNKKSSHGKILSAVRKVMAVTLVGIMLLTSQRPVLADSTKQDLSDANKAKEEIDKQIQTVKDKLNQLSNDKKNTENYIKELDLSIAQIDGDIHTLNGQIEDKKNEISEAQAHLELVQQQSDAQYESMKLRIKYMYENGTDTSYLNMLISAKNMSELLNKAEYINKITKYDRQMLDEYADLMSQIEEAKNLMSNDLQALEVMQIELDGQRQQLELIQNDKNAEMNRLNKDAASAKAYQEQLEKDRIEQERVIAQIEADLKRQEEEAKKNGQPVTKYDGGKFKWPTPSTRITSPWGDMEDRSSPHKGVDIGALKRGVSGDPVYAAYDGTVVTSTYSSSAGNWIWINHGDGLMTVYMHCSKLLVGVGTKVSKGDTIALMGTTGNSSGVHLHFGVRLNGNYVNPMPYFE